MYTIKNLIKTPKLKDKTFNILNISSRIKGLKDKTIKEPYNFEEC